MNTFSAPSQDLSQIINQSRANLESLRNANILILGGTGFIGKWVTQTLIKANLELELKMSISLVVRDIEKTQLMFERNQVLIEPVGEFLSENFLASNAIDFSHIIFAATPTSKNSEIYDNEILSLLIQALKIGALGKSKPSFLHLSSGAAGFTSSNDDYAILKRKIELIIEDYNSRGLVLGSNPRIFTTYGPGLPLSDKYAIGNFLFDGMTSNSIHVRGHPMTVRSYIYISDLISSLISLLVKPEIKRIDIGSPIAITIRELAETMSKEFDSRNIVYEKIEQKPTIYLPDSRYLHSNAVVVPLFEGVKKWRVWAEST